jgi:hypothetical protein
LSAERDVETVGMARGFDVHASGAFAQHLLDWVAGHEMNQEEYNGDDQPNDWNRVEQPGSDVLPHKIESRL